jgi:DNA-binding IclR family transcriptional regulator
MGSSPRVRDEHLIDSQRSAGRASVYRVQVLDRVLQLLDILAESNVDLGPAQLAARLSLHKSTVHRLLMVLERHRLIRRGVLPGKYGLGFKLFELGVRAGGGLDLQSCTEPHLRRLAEVTGESAYVSVLDGTETLSVARVAGPWTPSKPMPIGKRSPVYCTSSGKALIAFLPEDSLDDLLRRVKFVRYTPNTLMTRNALKAELSLIRERGYAVDDEENELGLRCVGGPIRDSSGTIIASIGIAGPIFRVTEGRVPSVAREVIATAHALSEEIRKSVRRPHTSYLRARRTP